jgi:hypothetical protein
MVVVEVKGASYHIADKLKEKWDKIKDGKLTKQDDDRVFIVDGRERSGKSVFAFQQACYIDPTLVGDLSRVCFTPDEFLAAIRNTVSNDKETKCIMFDEAFRGLASRATMSKVNKQINQALMEVGQKNLVLWIVLPSFFMLDIYPAMLRSNALFHISKDKKGNSRTFHVYARKKKNQLYQLGVRKGWSYNVRTGFKGRFPRKMPGGDAFDKAYRQKKADSINEKGEFETKKDVESKFKTQRDLLIRHLMEKEDLSLRKGKEYLDKIGIEMAFDHIGEIQRQLKEKERKMTNRQVILAENAAKLSGVGNISS